MGARVERLSVEPAAPAGEPALMAAGRLTRAMRIGEVAERTGTTPRTIRYYEEIGLLTGGTERQLGKHRCYDEQDVERILEIVRLKDLLGLTSSSCHSCSRQRARARRFVASSARPTIRGDSMRC